MKSKKVKSSDKHDENSKMDLDTAKEQAKKKMSNIVGKWFSDDPVLLSAWCIADKIHDEKQKTMGIDSRTNPPVIRYNPYFINALNQEQLECVMVSEGFKILLKHPTTRLLQPKEISSLASQITIDQCIMGNLLNINDYFPLPKLFNLEPNKFFEEYFRKLMDAIDKTKMTINKIFGEKKEGETEQGESESFTKYNDDKEALKDYFDPRGTSNKDWAKNDLMDADVTNLVKEKKDTADGWGKFTGDIRDVIIAANTPKVSCQEILRRFNVSILSSQTISSRMKINRRYDLQNPGYRRQYYSHIIFCVDASGSMDEDDLKEGFAVINSICKHAEIEYILFDTKIKLIEKKLKKARKEFKLLGRGGTDYKEIFEYAEKHKKDGMIIYTDGYANSVKKPKNTKVLWLMSKKEQKPPVDWGFTTTLDRFESHV